MNIFTATPGDLRAFKAMFADFGNVECLPTDPRQWPSKIDLLIFTGGEDVNPELYGGRSKGISYNKERDHYERSVFVRALRTGSPVNKILGICRGIQFLNVMLSGTLVRDIEEYYGKSHNNIHELKWKIPTIFTPALSKVNSLHHQCIYSIGSNRGYNVLATEPSTGAIEAIIWENKILGFQFHPEYFGNTMKEARDSVASGIVDWVTGKSIYEVKESPTKLPESPKSAYNKLYSTTKEDWS